MEEFLITILIWISGLNPNPGSTYTIERVVYADTNAIHSTAFTPQDESCMECHKEILEQKRKHSPVKESCTKCHLANGQKHPLEGVKGFNLVKKVPNLCYSCHEDMQNKKFLHAPAKEGKCIMCHNSHSSKNKKLLKEKKTVKLCYECHDPLNIPEGNVVHNPVSSGRCHKCHDSHQSNDSSFLKQSMPDLCYRCHDGVAAEMKLRRKHTAAKESCFNCHDPHSNKQSYLLPDTVPNLCFKCHDNLQAGKNPHQEKLNNDCKKCHAVHASKNKMLLTQKKAVTLCNECHQLEIPETNVVHNPVSSGRCNKCHDPHQNENGSFLKQKAPELCYRCHEDVATEMGMANTHAPAKEDCFKCHDAHSNQQSYLLPDTLPNLCYSCHTDFKNKLANSSRLHKAVNEGKYCANCHSAHGSSEKSMIKDDGKQVCLNCHDKEYKSEQRTIVNIQKLLENSKSIHGPVNSDCSACHDPHAANNMDLLRNKFPVGAYAPVTKENFALCFDCHNTELIEKERTRTATNFRNGDRNLHFVHTNGNRGRNCTTCHNMHASKNDHLIEDKAPYGNWEMPIKYKHNKNGGSCFPGCHKEQKYDR